MGWRCGITEAGLGARLFCWEDGFRLPFCVNNNRQPEKLSNRMEQQRIIAKVRTEQNHAASFSLQCRRVANAPSRISFQAAFPILHAPPSPHNSISNPPPFQVSSVSFFQQINLS